MTTWLYDLVAGFAESVLQSIGWGTIAIIAGVVLFAIAVISYMTHLMRKAMPFVIALGVAFIAGGGLSLIKLPERPKPKPWTITFPELPIITLPKLPEISKEDVRKLADAVFKTGEKAFLVAKDAIFASLEFVGDHVVRPVVTWFTKPSVDAEAMRQAELKRRAEYERRRTLELARQHKAMMRAQNEQARIMVDRIIAEGTARAIQQDQMEKQELMRRYQQAITPRMPGR